MKSVMTHQFSQVPRLNIQRSTFDRSHGYKTTMNSGYLVPFFVDEALPGDTFNLQATLFGRFSTPIVPIMDNVFLETFFFAVPARLVWSNFQKFMGEQENPGDSIDYLVPQLHSSYKDPDDITVQVLDSAFVTDEIADYFGIPPNVKQLSVNALPFRAYNLIWNEWFRNENLQNSVPVIKDDGSSQDEVNLYKLLKRCKRKDYFTSALPWPQNGPGVELPIGDVAPVVTGSMLDYNVLKSEQPLYWANHVTGFKYISSNSTNQPVLYAGVSNSLSGGTGIAHTSGTSWSPAVTDGVVPGNLYADLSSATMATINSVRQAFQVQRFLERSAVGGHRYTELIRAMFGVLSPDARLQRPEYLGGGSSQIHFQPVPQQSATDSVTPQGNMAAYGIVAGTNHGFVKSFTEHTYIIGLVNLRADLNYQQGINRMWSRKTRFDFYWPTFAHLGEQSILNKEIFAQGAGVKDSDNNVVDEKVFGYQERYAEYRYFPSLITGKFRSDDPQSLDVWHLAQQFANLPALNAEFIEDNPPISRILAVQDEPEVLLDVYFNMKCTRPMPLYGVPGLVDHF